MSARNKDIIKKLSPVAVKAALLAGKFLKKNLPSSRKVRQAFAHDVKIEADIQSEKIIKDYLKKHSKLTILSEEAGLETLDQNDLFWVVDPVDGSLNYFQQIPMCCVSIGLWKKETPLFGVIYDFIHDELFTGSLNGGAYLNGKKIQVSKIKKKSQGIMCSGFPNSTDYSKKGVELFVKQVQIFRKLRFLGSAALSIVYVAAGRAEAYYENDIKLWDIAGALPILLAAGGKMKLQKKPKPYCYTVYATNGRI